MNTRKFALVNGVLLLSLSAALTHAHTRWNPDGELKPRPHANGSFGDDLKSGPCGNLPRTNTPAVFIAGATITVEFESTIYHQGEFRIAFSPENDSGFDNHVLADNIPDYPNQRYRSYEITLPDTECNDCTLQLIQTMPDRTPATNYFSCADIQLVAAENPQPPQLENFDAGEFSNAVQLDWIAPANGLQVLVVESTQNQPPNIVDGQEFAIGDTIQDAQVISTDADPGLMLSDRETGQTYHYFAYTFDGDWNYSAPAHAQITLEASSPGNTVGGSLNGWGLMCLAIFLGVFRRRRHNR